MRFKLLNVKLISEMNVWSRNHFIKKQSQWIKRIQQLMNKECLIICCPGIRHKWHLRKSLLHFKQVLSKSQISSDDISRCCCCCCISGFNKSIRPSPPLLLLLELFLLRLFSCPMRAKSCDELTYNKDLNNFV